MAFTDHGTTPVRSRRTPIIICKPTTPSRPHIRPRRGRSAVRQAEQPPPRHRGSASELLPDSAACLPPPPLLSPRSPPLPACCRARSSSWADSRARPPAAASMAEVLVPRRPHGGGTRPTTPLTRFGLLLKLWQSPPPRSGAGGLLPASGRCSFLLVGGRILLPPLVVHAAVLLTGSRILLRVRLRGARRHRGGPQRSPVASSRRRPPLLDILRRPPGVDVPPSSQGWRERTGC
jgi:hypothetical protein